jgi:cytochrome d ubiquinol oxidase subunit II
MSLEELPPAELVGGVGALALIAYGILGGADFGGGVWDLFARGPRRQEQRTAIAHAMGPVWEANHVWLIFVIVVAFTAFPPAFRELSLGLFLPFHLILIGITLRGAAFVFRSHQAEDRPTNTWGTTFGVASVITPVLLGMAFGAVSAGGLDWLAPVSLATGALALALCAYLAAVYLTNETSGELQEDFRRRALLAGTFVVAGATVMLPLLYLEAHHLWNGLISWRAAPVIAAGVAAELLSGWALLRRRYSLARFSAVAQVALLFAGWGLAQYPYLIWDADPQKAQQVQTAKAPDATLWFVLGTLPVGLGLLLPSLWFLFVIFKTENREQRTENR